jgi:hypothetical protein
MGDDQWVMGVGRWALGDGNGSPFEHKTHVDVDSTIDFRDSRSLHFFEDHFPVRLDEFPHVVVDTELLANVGAPAT